MRTFKIRYETHAGSDLIIYAASNLDSAVEMFEAGFVRVGQRVPLILSITSEHTEYR